MSGITGSDQDMALQSLMTDIVRSARFKLVEPLVSESRKLGKLIDELHSKDRQELEAIRERMNRLEEAVQATPLLLLNAIKEAISQVGMDGKL